MTRLRTQGIIVMVLMLAGTMTGYGQNWQLSGNSDATGTSKLGTTNAVDVRLFTNDVERMRITSAGNIGIGTTAPSGAALLDLSSTTRGLLIPRMTQAQRNAIASPPNGLIIFQTDGTQGVYYYQGTSWRRVANHTLSNLGTTSINASLLPNADNTRDLGSATNSWKDLWIDGQLYLGGGRFLARNGTGSTWLGVSAGIASTGTGNTGVGFHALFSNTTGSYNTASGYEALYSNTTGHWNTASGSGALYSNTTGYSNTASGSGALYSNTTGYWNTASGSLALYSNTTGVSNTASGYEALYSNTTGHWNTASGYLALYSNTTGVSNTASGSGALYSNTTGYYNTASGSGALYSNTTGVSNTASGYQALSSNTTGYYNTASGYRALYSNTTGQYNTASGYQALYNNTTGQYNTASGMWALFFNTTQSENTAVGFSAGDGYTSTQGTFLGVSAYPNANGYTNVTGLGYDARPTGSNQVRVGNSSVTSIGGQVGWTTFSDGRYKKNISEDVRGLDFILKLRPVTYNLSVHELAAYLKEGQKRDKEGNIVMETDELDRTAREAKERIRYTGFIAQEVEAAARATGFDFSGVDAPDNETDLYGLRYAEFVVPLVKAVQEQQQIITSQQARIEQQQQQIEQLMHEVALLKGQGAVPVQKSTGGSAGLHADPNPLRESAIITISGKVSNGAVLIVRDHTGRTVRTLPAGPGRMEISMQDLAAGIYTITLLDGGQTVATARLVKE